MLSISRSSPLAISLALLTMSGCGGAATPPGSQAAPLGGLSPLVRPSGHRSSASSPIQHVILIIQENHSFDNLFQGYPGANTQSYGYDSSGQQIPLKPEHLGWSVDLSHQLNDFIGNYDNGKMDGFDLNRRGGGAKLRAYTYTEQTDVQPYISLANQYVLADNYFPSQLDASFAAHQYLIAAQANDSVNLPDTRWGCDGGSSDTVPTLTGTIQNPTLGAPEIVCFGNQSQTNSYETLGDLIDQAGLTWRWYAPKAFQKGYTWMAYQAVAHTRYGPDWNNIYYPSAKVLTDIADGQLANVTWVTPTLKTSDHPGSNSQAGPSWVASIVNAVGSSPFWSSTAIFVVWDEWGGEYDHVPPPQLFLGGLGIRVPMLCISPYAYTGVVNHTQLESSGILTFIEDTFGLPRLQDANGNPVRDSMATDAGSGCIDPSQRARPFKPVRAPLGPAFFLTPHPDTAMPNYFDD